MQLRCDVLIIGGGPAGTAVALALQQCGVQALVAERRCYNVAGGSRGESLFGETRSLLTILGVWEQFSSGLVIAAAPFNSIWGDAETRARSSALNPWGDGWFIDRNWFDAMLARAAEAAGALVYCNVRPSDATRVQHGWRVTLDSAGRRAEVETRYVVDATGRSAWMARRTGAHQRSIDKLVGFMGKYESTLSRPILLVEAVCDGWWYSAPWPGNGALAVYLTDGDNVAGRSPKKMYWTYLTKADYTRQRMAGLGEPSIRTVSASTYELDHCVGDRWLAVGDAACAIDPLSGSGIGCALESGLRAATAISASLRGERNALASYQHDVARQFSAQLQARRHYYGLERRWRSSLFWARRRNYQST
jgi:flavin-dependent dehydrogenase